MTRVYAEKDGDRYQIFARGHATGSPEVCAAISGILYALLGYVKNAQDGSTLAYSDRISSGNVAIDFRGGESAEAVFDMAVIGLCQIEKSCPEYIHVETAEIS